MTAQSQAAQWADLREMHDRRQDLAHLSASIVDRQQRIAAGHLDEQQALTRYHRLKRQELLDVQAAEQSSVTLSRARDNKAEVDGLDRFQQAQRDQLVQRQQLEQRVVQEQAQLTTDLQARQLQQVEELLQRANQGGSEAVNTLDNQRQELEARHQQERAQLDAYFNDQIQALKNHHDAVKSQLDRDQGELQRALYESQPGVERQAALQEVLAQQEVARQELTRVIEEQLAERQREYEAVQSRLSAEQLDALRTQVAQRIDGRPLPDDSLKRIAQEARILDNEQQQQSAQAQFNREKVAIEWAKGQILEELLTLEIKGKAAVENATRASNRQLEFIEGDRIRDSHGHKLTDGLLAWWDQDKKTLHVEEAYEAKAGSRGARELNRKIYALSGADREEMRRYARDLARDEVVGAQENVEEQSRRINALTEEQARRINELTEKYSQELLEYKVQAERGGQVQQTIERLDTGRILIDGHPVTLAADEGRAHVVKVLPKDVAVRDQNALHIDVTQKQLAAAAQAFVDELKRQRTW